MRKPLKLKKKNPSAAKTLSKVSSATRLQDLANGNVRVIHSQSLRQVIGYQSAEANYGIECEVDPTNAKEATKLMEEIVQRKLIPKAKEHQGYLLRLAQSNNGGPTRR